MLVLSMSITMRHLSKYILPTLAVFLFSCGSSTSDTTEGQAGVQADVQRSFKEVVISTGEPRHIADLSISGMSCEMMCGGSIRKALAKLPGVDATEIVFDEDEALDHAVVTFDPAKVSEQALIDAVHALHDGQYKVASIAITRQVMGEAADPSNTEGASRELGVGAYQIPLPSLPSVLDMLFRLVRP